MSYKSKIVHLSQKYLSQLTCGICNDIYDDPVVLNCCGKTGCKSCIEEWVENRRTCPYDSRHGLNSNVFRRSPKELFDKLNKLKVECVYQKYGCIQMLTKPQFENHLKTCPFNTCEICELRKQFGSEHNCVQQLKDQNKNLKYQSKRMSDENKLFSDKNIKMSEIISKLKTKIKALKETNVKLENDTKTSNTGRKDIKNTDSAPIGLQNGILDSNARNNNSNIIQTIFQYIFRLILSVFHIYGDTAVGPSSQNQRTRNDYKSLIERNSKLTEECLTLKTTTNKLIKEIEILSKNENHNKSTARKLNLDLIIAQNKMYKRKIKLDIIRKDYQELKLDLNNLTRLFENIKANGSEQFYAQTCFWQVVKLVLAPEWVTEIFEVVLEYLFADAHIWWLNNQNPALIMYTYTCIYCLLNTLIAIIIWKFWGPPKYNDYVNWHRQLTNISPSVNQLAQRRRR